MSGKFKRARRLDWVTASKPSLDAILTLPHPFFNQEPSLMQFWPSRAPVFQSRTFLDAILTLAHPHFSIKNLPWCNFRPRAPLFFNQEPSLIELWPSCTRIFQSRTFLDWIMILSSTSTRFSIKNLPWCNFRPRALLFFNQEPLFGNNATSSKIPR